MINVNDIDDIYKLLKREMPNVDISIFYRQHIDSLRVIAVGDFGIIEIYSTGIKYTSPRATAKHILAEIEERILKKYLYSGKNPESV